MKHIIEFEIDGKQKQEVIHDCKDAGTAFAKCQTANPGAKMLHCTAEGGVGVSRGVIEYDPPPVQRDPGKQPRPCRAPKPDEKDGVMPFYDSVLSQKALVK